MAEDISTLIAPPALPENDPIALFFLRYGPAAGEEGPERFVREQLSAEPDPWQIKVLRAFGRGERLIAVRSCHGPGKTAVAAWLVCIMLATRLPQKTVATAPSSSQLEGALLPEVKMWWGRLPPEIRDLFDVKAKGIYEKMTPHGSESYFEARTSRAESPEALQGVHSDHVLLIADEASGVPEVVFNAAAGSMSSEHATTLLIGNPVRGSGFFYEAFHSLKDMWVTIQVAHYDSPRVTEEFVEQIRRHHGEDSNEFRVRCLGEFPKADDDTLIPRAWLEEAAERDVEDLPGARRVWGVDVARFGSDKNVVAVRTPRTAKILDHWGQADTMASVARVKRLFDEALPGEKPDVILVDEIGMGAGVLDRLRQLGLPARGVNVAEAASMGEKFNRARSELWWRCREWFQGKGVRLEPGRDDREDPQRILANELAAIRYSYTPSGKVAVEGKDELRKRIHKSPDYADALVLTFAEDLVNLTWGSDNSFSWGKPIKRGLSIV